MERDAIVEATKLAAAVADLLQEAAAIAARGTEKSEVRYAEALARTLYDQLSAMRASRAA